MGEGSCLWHFAKAAVLPALCFRNSFKSRCWNNHRVNFPSQGSQSLVVCDPSFFWPFYRACQILVLWPGIKPMPTVAEEWILNRSPPGMSLIRFLIAWYPLLLLIFLWSYPFQRDYNPWEERPPLTLLCTDHNAGAGMHTVKSATHLWVDHHIFSSWNSAYWGLTHDGKPMNVTFLIQLATFSMWKHSLKRKHLCSHLIFKELTLWLFLLKINSHIHYSTELWEKFLGPNHTDWSKMNSLSLLIWISSLSFLFVSQLFSKKDRTLFPIQAFADKAMKGRTEN